MFDIQGLIRLNRRHKRWYGTPSWRNLETAKVAADKQAGREQAPARVYKRGTKFYVRPCLLAGIETAEDMPGATLVYTANP